MADSYVREVGTVAAMDDLTIEVGVACDTVSLQLGFGVAPRRLTSDQAEEFARLFVRACREAGQNARQMAGEVHEADGGDSMDYCGLVDGIYECTETGPHRVHLARDLYNQIVHAWDREASGKAERPPAAAVPGCIDPPCTGECEAGDG